MTDEHRRAPRKRLQHFLPVLDAGSRLPLGRLVDISASGMMLISSEPLPVDCEFHLEIQPLPDSGLLPVQLTAVSVWCRASTHNNTHHGCGLKFVNLNALEQADLSALIRAQDL